MRERSNLFHSSIVFAHIANCTKKNVMCAVSIFHTFEDFEMETNKTTTNYYVEKFNITLIYNIPDICAPIYSAGEEPRIQQQKTFQTIFQTKAMR